MKKRFDFIEWLLDGGIWCFVGLIIAGLLSLLADGIFCKEIPFEGKIIDKFYKAESHQSGTGVGVSSSGKPGVIITSSHESEKFLVMVQAGDGTILTSEAPAELYYKKYIGENAKGYINTGCIFGLNWGNKLTN